MRLCVYVCSGGGNFYVHGNYMRACVCERETGGYFPLELNSMGLEKINTGQAVSVELVLVIGQVPRDSQLWQQVCVPFTRFWLESAMCLFVFVIILLFSWKLTLALTANRSSPGHCPGHQAEDMEEILLSLEASSG